MRVRKAVRLAAIITLAALFPAYADELTLQENAPDRYVVVKGDTLWDISGKFLKDPWRWPQIWNLNKDEIKNPHWIYPGDVIVMDQSAGGPRLRLLGHEGNDKLRGAHKLDPRIRVTQFEPQAAPAIPREAIEAFLQKPMVVDQLAFEKAPRIALGSESRVAVTQGDTAYAVDLSGQAGQAWQVFHGGKELRDPDTKEVLGYEVSYVGEALVREVDTVSTVQITHATTEILLGDRLLPKPPRDFANYVPRTPEANIQGKVISTYGGVNDAGPYTTVVINRGERDGLARGHVLYSYKAKRLVRKLDRDEADRYTPIARNGSVFIYRVFPKLAYGLVLGTQDAVNLQDEVRKP